MMNKKYCSNLKIAKNCDICERNHGYIGMYLDKNNFVSCSLYQNLSGEVFCPIYYADHLEDFKEIENE